jgi:phospholipid transport system substrate-binding protein
VLSFRPSTGCRTPAAAILCALAIVANASDPTPALSAVSPQPVAVVQNLQSALLELMQNSTDLGYTGRRDRIAPVVERSFDLPFIARKSAGRHWKQLSEPDRARVLDALSRLSIATYAARFNSYSGERFEVLSEEPGIKDTQLIRTQLVAPERTVRLDYRLHNSNGGWQIIDVIVDGSVSELALRRSQYSAVIKRDGIDGLLSKLEEKIELRESTPEPSEAPGRS